MIQWYNNLDVKLQAALIVGGIAFVIAWVMDGG